jgi:hypothetical protein
MEEVVGSIPISSTNQIKHFKATPFRDFVAFLSQIPKLPHAPVVPLIMKQRLNICVTG